MLVPATVGRQCLASSATQHELARVELLAGLPGETLAKLAKRMEREEVAPGTAIVREGEPGDRFYVVFAGMLSVYEQRDGARATCCVRATTSARWRSRWTCRAPRR